MSDDASMVKLPGDFKVKEEILGDPAPTVITDFMLPKSIKALPIIIWGIVFIVGIINFVIYPANPSYMADRETAIITWCFYTGELMLMPYLLLYIKNKINFSVEQEHRITNITREQHLKLKKRIFGPVGVIMVIVFTLIFAIYDINGYGMNVTIPYILPNGAEGWLTDMASFTNVADPNNLINVAYYASMFQAYLFLIEWIAFFFFQSQFLWYVIGYLWYFGTVNGKYEYRENVTLVIKLGLTQPVSHSVVEIGWGYIPILILECIYQFVLPLFVVPDIWLMDTVSTVLILVFFLLVTIVPPIQIANDLKREVKETTHDAEILGAHAIEDAVLKAQTEGGIAINEAVSAILFSMYVQQMKAKQGMSSGVQKKIVGSAAGPVASYGAKEGISLSGVHL